MLVVAVIVVFPFFRPVTTPELFTNATLELLLVQVIVLSLTFEGEIVAFKLTLEPILIVLVWGVNVIFSAFTTSFLTVTILLTDTLSIVPVIVTFPSFKAVIFPVEVSTLAIVLSVLDHLIFLLVALLGVIVAFKVLVSPSNIVKSFSFKTILSTLMILFSTETLQVSVIPLLLSTLIVANPGPTAVIWPDWLIWTTFVLSLDHVTFLFVALLGVTVTWSVVLSPFVRLILFLSRFTLLTSIIFFSIITLHVSAIPL